MRDSRSPSRSTNSNDPNSRYGRASSTNSSETPRAFAPALALRKPKQDPYNYQSYDKSQGDFSFLQASPTSEATGTWSTIDMDTNTRQWDSRYDKQQAERKEGSEGQSSFRASNTSNEPWVGWTNKSFGHDNNSEARSTSIAPLEDHKLDIDEEVRERFVDSRKIMRENRHLSEFEQRNKRVLKQDFSMPIVNVIGGKPVNVVQPKIDDRAEYRDRSGNYVDGVDRGKMKKRYEDEWSKRMQTRDDEMVLLTKKKREWDILSPAEKEQRLRKREVNKALVSQLGAGMGPSASSDVFTYDEIPDIYLRAVDSKRVTDWVTEHSSSTVPSIPDDPHFSEFQSESLSTPSKHGSIVPTKPRGWQWHHFNQGNKQPRFSTVRGRLDEHHFSQFESGDFSSSSTHSSATPTKPRGLQGRRSNPTEKRPLTNPGDQHDYRKAFKKFKLGDSPRETSDRSSNQSTGTNSTNPIPRPGQEGPHNVITSGLSDTVTPTDQTSSVVTDSTATVVDHGPDLVALNDLTEEEQEFTDTEGGLDFFDMIRPACTTMGRILAITLHEPVKYSTSAIADRLFGGVVQEIQYFPTERMALVVFVFPLEAAAVVRHVKNARENDKHALVRLQIHVDWYRGLNIEAIYPAQAHILASVLAEKASRVLLVRGIPVTTTTASFAHDMKTRFYDKLLVKVAITSSTKRYVQKRDGNMGIIEFAGIKDAIEIKNRFIRKEVQDYESSTVDFLADSCTKTPVKMPYCDCLYCRSESYR